MTEGTLQFLGTGSSLGVPVIGCKCSNCLSKDPKNKRMRSSALLQIKDKSILIDAGPDHREQALFYGIDHLDGMIITHDHYDHVGGMDDLKVYSYNKAPLPCLLSAPTYGSLKNRFSYLYSPNAKFFSCQLVKELFDKVVFEEIPIECVSFYQKDMQVMGMKIGDLAYISDIKTYDDKLITALKGIKTLIISAVINRSTDMHISLEEAIAFSKSVEAKVTYLTHLGHETNYVELQKVLPESVFPAYDGLVVSFHMPQE